jgi:ribosomal protein S18 acetylase RimI-like enzyme
MNVVQIVAAESPEQLEQLRGLLVEYAGSLSYHICFESFRQELAHLPGVYGPPDGRLFLALAGAQPAGCVALRLVEQGVGEMKRLYVRPAFRGRGLGRELSERILSEACALGYRAIRLDTLPSMREAQTLYRSLGFKAVDASHSVRGEKPIDMELQLT